MSKVAPSILLKQLILEKQIEHELEGKLLKEHFHVTYESLKPINLIKNTIKDAISSPNIGGNLINSSIGLATGFFARKLFIGGSHNPIRKIAGTILELVIGSKVAANADEIKSIAGIILKKVIRKKENTQQPTS